ncbi:hypothetical protein BSNK01_20350 [Bacillaceae bacterium]
MSNARVAIVVKASPDATFQSVLEIGSLRFRRNLLHAKAHATAWHPLSDAYVVVQEKSLTKTAVVGEDGNLYDPQRGQKLELSPSMKRKLKTYVTVLRKKHYGDLLSWEEVKRIIPRKSNFDVIDLETGLRFRVQRRAGSNHADVQPLSKADTQIMKEIYEGRWSWKRRAILVDTGTRLIAASMHGMPHGKGALRNGFPGHFCVHFYNSTTHRSKKMDPAHQLMVLKAAGRLQAHLQTAGPYQLVDAFLIALHQRDVQLLKMTLLPSARKHAESYLQKYADIETLRKLSPFADEAPPALVASEIPVDVQIIRQGNRQERQAILFRLVRNSPAEPWGIALPEISSEDPSVKESTLEKQKNTQHKSSK